MMLTVVNYERDQASLAEFAPPGDFQGALSLPPQTLAARLMGDFANVIDFSAPAEFGMQAPEKFVAASLAVADYRKARGTLEDSYELVGSGGDGIVLDPKPTTPRGALMAGVSCELWPVPDSTSGRLLCGTESPLPRPLVNYLIGRAKRGARAQTVVRFEFTAAGWEYVRKPERAKRAGSSATSEAEKLGEKMGLQWLDDIGGLALDASFQGDQIEVGLELPFRSTHSIFSSVTLGKPVEAAPDAFFTLEHDSALLLFFSGMERGARAQETHALLESLVALETASDFDPAGRTALADVYASLFLTGGPLVLALGPNDGSSEAALHSFLSGNVEDRALLKKFREDSDGWLLAGMPEPASKWVDGIRKYIAIQNKYGRVRLSNAGGSAKGNKGPQNGSSEATRMHADSRTELLVRYTEQPTPPGLTNGAHFTIQEYLNQDFVRAHGALPATPLQRELLINEIAGYTWLCRARKQELCAEKFDQIRAGNVNVRTGSRVAPSTSMLAYGSPRRALGFFAKGSTLKTLRKASDALEKLCKLPDEGTRPFLIVGSQENSQGNGPGSVRFTLQVPMEGLRELVQQMK